MHKSKILVVLAMVAVAAAFADAQIIFEIKRPKKTKPLGEYKKEFKKLEVRSRNLTDEKYYGAWTIKTKQGAEKRFSDFSDFDKGMFYLWQAEKLTKDLEAKAEAWKDDESAAQAGGDDPQDGEPAPKEEIKKFNLLLQALRLDTAARYEQLVESFFKTHADKFSEREVLAYAAKVKAYHQKHNLTRKEEKK